MEAEWRRRRFSFACSAGCKQVEREDTSSLVPQLLEMRHSFYSLRDALESGLAFAVGFCPEAIPARLTVVLIRWVLSGLGAYAE